MSIIRSIKIFYILCKHNALFPLKRIFLLSLINRLRSLFDYSKKNDGERLTSAFEELGPFFIKFGQFLSTKPDLVGDDIANHLSKLQDQIPAIKYQYIEDTLIAEFGRNIFTDFENEAVAAASIAQVHKAKINDEIVAVKILRPNIENDFRKDLKLLHNIANFVNKHITLAKRLRLPDLVSIFENIVKMELDLRLEAAAAEEMKENLKNDHGVYIPKIFWEYTTKNILTLEWIDGISVYNTEKLIDRKFNLQDIASKIAVMFFNQAYRDGFFHADLHPGNLLIDKYGRLVLIDFGIMGRLDKKTRLIVAEILDGFLKRDYDRIAKIHFDAGYIAKDKSQKLFAQALRAIGEPIVGLPSNQISIAKLLAHLFKVTEDFDMYVQPQLLLLQKTTILVEALGSRLWPQVNIWKLAEPWIEDWAIKNIGIEAKIRDILYEIVNKFIEKIKDAYSN